MILYDGSCKLKKLFYKSFKLKALMKKIDIQNGEYVKSIFEEKLFSFINNCNVTKKMLIGFGEFMGQVPDDTIIEIKYQIQFFKMGLRFLPILQKKIQEMRTRRMKSLGILLATLALTK
jgi:hypothetical protein